MSAETRRREAHADMHQSRDGEVTCGSCGRSWCYTCHPTPAHLCPWCNGDESGVAHSGAVIRLIGGRIPQ